MSKEGSSIDPKSEAKEHTMQREELLAMADKIESEDKYLPRTYEMLSEFKSFLEDNLRTFRLASALTESQGSKIRAYELGLKMNGGLAEAIKGLNIVLASIEDAELLKQKK